MTKFIRWSGAAAISGGALLVAGTVIHALEPRGCVGAECASRPMRESGALEGVLVLVGALLVLAGVTGLVLLSRDTGRFGRAGRTGVQVGVAGLVVLLMAGLAQGLVFGVDFALMPYLVWPAMLAVVVGFALLGIEVMRARVLPGWAGALLILGSLGLTAANEQTSLVLLAIPFAVAWMAVGYVLWSRGSRPAATPALTPP